MHGKLILRNLNVFQWKTIDNFSLKHFSETTKLSKLFPFCSSNLFLFYCKKITKALYKTLNWIELLLLFLLLSITQKAGINLKIFSGLNIWIYKQLKSFINPNISEYFLFLRQHTHSNFSFQWQKLVVIKK